MVLPTELVTSLYIEEFGIVGVGMKAAPIASQDDVKPTRASTRIGERRQRFDSGTWQPSLEGEVSTTLASAATKSVVEKNAEKKSSPVRLKKKSEASTPVKKTKKGVPPLRHPLPPPKSPPRGKSKEESLSAPSRSPLPKSPPRTIKQAPPLPCCKPPYSFYSPTDTPSFAKCIESLVYVLRTCRNIAVLTGAGISVSCGVPDFRSKDVGLYSVLDCAALGLSCPEELFDWEFFQNNPQPFFQFAKRLYFPLQNNQKVRPSDSHKLLRLLQDRKQLLRVYSQNIDGLEEEAGVVTRKVVYAHGSLKWATCLTCKRRVPADELEDSILQGTVPLCPVIRKSKQHQQQQGTDGNDTSSAPKADLPPNPIIRREPSARQRKRPRSLDDDKREDNSSSSGGCDKDKNAANVAPERPRRQISTSSSASSSSRSVPLNACGGILKPNVTFFGQTLPDAVSRCLESDRKKVDALIVIGTSLSVAPISKVIGYLPANIPRILINRTIVHPQHQASSSTAEGTMDDDNDETEEPDFRDNYVFDAYLLGNCDDVTRALVKKLRAEEESEGAPLHNMQDDLEEMGRLLSEVRSEEEEQRNDDGDDDEDDCEVLYRAQDWETATVPAERVFLFPGAQPPSPPLEESVELQEVCHCNVCSKRIVKGHIHKCLTCFDYDLCSSCFPKVSKKHYEGKHQFGKEKVQVTSNR